MRHVKNLNPLSTESKPQTGKVTPDEMKTESLKAKCYEHDIGKFWVEMTRFYHERWTSKYGVTDADGFWSKGLSDLSGRAISFGLSKLEKSFPSWPPNLFEFKNLCNPTGADLGLPDFETCLRHACNHQWTHPFVYHIARKVGTKTLAAMHEKVARRALERAYDEGVKDVLNGKAYDAPRADKFQLKDSGQKNALTNEQKQDFLNKARQALTGGYANEQSTATQI